MRPLGPWGGAARRIPARSAAWMAGGVVGEGLGFTRDRFVCLHAAGRGPVGGHGGDRRRPLLEALPDELMARSGQQAGVEDFVVQEEGRSGTVGRCKRPEHGFTVTPWAAAMAAWWRCVARRRTATPLFIGALKAVERLTCAPRRGKVVRVAAWAVGAATTCSGLLAKGGEAVRRPAGERGTRGAGQRHVQELPRRRMD
jgi:hypothetical protein